MVGSILVGREDHQWPQARRQRVSLDGASLISPLDDQPKSGMRLTKYHLLVTVSFIISAALSYTCWQDLISSRLDIFGIHIQSSPKDELERALERASMGNKTVMISVLNKAYANDGGLFDLFLEGFKKGENTSVLLNHLLLLAFDQKSYERCNLLHHHCYKVAVDGADFSDELYYMSSGYLNMLWRKTRFLIQVLKRGYSFLFTDMDILWLRNPLDVLKHEGDDFQFSCDTYTGKPYDEDNPANIGFYLVASNNKSIALFETLYAKRNNTGGKKQQDLLMEMKDKGVFRQLGLKVRYLDDRYIAGFCSIGQYNDKVRTIHANCCRGIKAKMIDLRLVLDEWEGYCNGTLTKLKWPRHTECLHSWA